MKTISKSHLFGETKEQKKRSGIEPGYINTPSVSRHYGVCKNLEA